MDGKKPPLGFMESQGSAPYPHDNYPPQPAPTHNYASPPPYSVVPPSQQQPQPMMMQQPHPMMMQQPQPMMMQQQQPIMVQQQPQLMVHQTQPQGHSTVVVSQAPAGCPHTVVDSDFTTCGLLWLIFCFPIGVICCLTMKERRCIRCGVRF